MRPGDEVQLEVTTLSGRGDGSGDVEGVTVHVGGAYPGETVRARIDAVSKHHPRAFASLLEVVTPHPGRRTPPCRRHPARGGWCTGCPLMPLSIDAQREIVLGRAGALGLPIEGAMQGGEPQGYRHSSKRVAGWREGRVILGSYVRGSHDVADMRGCLVDHPRITAVADAIEDAATELGIDPYDGHEGDLRYVWLKTDGEHVLVTLISAAPATRAPELASKLGDDVSVAWSVQPSEGNAIRGGAARSVSGRSELEIAVGEQRTRVGPLGFLQPNPAVAAQAYEALVRLPDGSPATGALALDLYAGAGVTTAMLRRSFSEVIPCESYPESAKALGVEPEKALPFVRRMAGRAVDLVLANPPRAGLGAEVCAAIVELAPARVHVMSCDAESLARDLGALEGAFELERVVAFDTLPQTPHLELVAHLRRKA